MQLTSRQATVSWGIDHSCCGTADQETRCNPRRYSHAREAVGRSSVLNYRHDDAVTLQSCASPVTNATATYGSSAGVQHSHVLGDYGVDLSRNHDHGRVVDGIRWGDRRYTAATAAEERPSADVFDRARHNASEAYMSISAESSVTSGSTYIDERSASSSNTGYASSDGAADVLDVRAAGSGTNFGTHEAMRSEIWLI